MALEEYSIDRLPGGEYLDPWVVCRCGWEGPFLVLSPLKEGDPCPHCEKDKFEKFLLSFSVEEAEKLREILRDYHINL